MTDHFDGGRLRFGVWLDRCHNWGLGAEFFKLGGESETFTATSSGNPILARPFFNTETGVDDAELVAFPGVLAGTVGVWRAADCRVPACTSGIYAAATKVAAAGCSADARSTIALAPRRCSVTAYLQLDERVQINGKFG